MTPGTARDIYTSFWRHRHSLSDRCTSLIHAADRLKVPFWDFVPLHFIGAYATLIVPFGHSANNKFRIQQLSPSVKTFGAADSVTTRLLESFSSTKAAAVRAVTFSGAALSCI